MEKHLPTVNAKAQAPQSPAPRLPYEERLLRSPSNPATGKPAAELWTPPAVIPLKATLEAALVAYDAMLRPCGASGIANMMAHTMLVTAIPGLDGLDQVEQRDHLVAQVGAYVVHLVHLPLDILTEAARAHCNESKWFPKPAELLKFAAPSLFERQQQRARLVALIANYDAHRLGSKPYVKPPYEERVRGMIASYRKIGNERRAQELEAELADHLAKNREGVAA